MSQLLPIAILAGGLASRMRPHTEKLPKALLDVAGEPFIAHQLRLLAESGVTDVVVCTGFLGEMIEEQIGNGKQFGLRVRYSRDGDKLRGTAGAIKRALPLLGPAFFVMYGDSYLPCDYAAIQQTFLASGKLALMTVYRNAGQFDGSNVEYSDGRILVYDKKRPTESMQHIDYGLGVICGAAFASVPNDQPSDLAGLYQRLLAANDLASFEVPDRFYEIGSLEGWRDTAQYISSRSSKERKSA